MDLLRLSLKDYAASRGIGYFAAWRRLRKGTLQGRKLKDGRIRLLRESPAAGRRGRPSLWTREKALAAVRRLCAARYVQTGEFPPYLYKLCRRLFGSIRAAKWQAGVIRDRRRALPRPSGPEGPRWNRASFLAWVGDFCGRSGHKQAAWPAYMRHLAKVHCGSVRGALYAAGAIRDPRRSGNRNRRWAAAVLALLFLHGSAALRCGPPPGGFYQDQLRQNAALKEHNYQLYAGPRPSCHAAQILAQGDALNRNAGYFGPLGVNAADLRQLERAQGMDSSLRESALVRLSGGVAREIRSLQEGRARVLASALNPADGTPITYDKGTLRAAAGRLQGLAEEAQRLGAYLSGSFKSECALQAAAPYLERPDILQRTVQTDRLARFYLEGDGAGFEGVSGLQGSLRSAAARLSGLARQIEEREEGMRAQFAQQYILCGLTLAASFVTAGAAAAGTAAFWSSMAGAAGSAASLGGSVRNHVIVNEKGLEGLRSRAEAEGELGLQAFQDLSSAASILSGLRGMSRSLRIAVEDARSGAAGFQALTLGQKGYVVYRYADAAVETADLAGLPGRALGEEGRSYLKAALAGADLSFQFGGVRDRFNAKLSAPGVDSSLFDDPRLPRDALRSISLATLSGQFVAATQDALSVSQAFPAAREFFRSHSFALQLGQQALQWAQARDQAIAMPSLPKNLENLRQTYADAMESVRAGRNPDLRRSDGSVIRFGLRNLESLCQPQIRQETLDRLYGRKPAEIREVERPPVLYSLVAADESALRSSSARFNADAALDPFKFAVGNPSLYMNRLEIGKDSVQMADSDGRKLSAEYFKGSGWKINERLGDSQREIEVPEKARPQSFERLRFIQDGAGRMVALFAQPASSQGEKSLEFFIAGGGERGGGIVSGLGGALYGDGRVRLYSDFYKDRFLQLSGRESWTMDIGLGRPSLAGGPVLAALPENLFLGVTDPKAGNVSFESLAKIGALTPTGTGAFFRPSAGLYFEQLGGIWQASLSDRSRTGGAMRSSQQNYLLLSESIKPNLSSREFFRDYFPAPVLRTLQRDGINLVDAETGEVSRSSLARFYARTDPFQAGGPALQGYNFSGGVHYRETWDGRSQILKPAFAYPALLGFSAGKLRAQSLDPRGFNPESWTILQQRQALSPSGRIFTWDRLAFYGVDRQAYRSDGSDDLNNPVFTEYHQKGRILADDLLSGNWKQRVRVVRQEANTFADARKAGQESRWALEELNSEVNKSPLTRPEPYLALMSDVPALAQTSLKYRLSGAAQDFLNAKGATDPGAIRAAAQALRVAAGNIRMDGFRLAEYANAAPLGAESEAGRVHSVLNDSVLEAGSLSWQFREISAQMKEMTVGEVDRVDQEDFNSVLCEIRRGLDHFAEAAAFSGSNHGNCFRADSGRIGLLPGLLERTLWSPGRQENPLFRLRSLAYNVAANAGTQEREFDGDWVRDSRLGLGFYASLFSGDLFDKPRAQRFDPDRPAILYVNGVLTSREEARQTAAVIGWDAGGPPVERLLNGTHGAGDFVQVLGHELGALDVTGVRAAQAIRGALRDHDALYLLAYSQGSAVGKQGLSLLTPEERGRIFYIGAGPQQYVDRENLGLAFAANLRNAADPVPYINGPMRALRLRPIMQSWEVLAPNPTLGDGPFAAHALLPNYISGMSRVLNGLLEARSIR